MGLRLIILLLLSFGLKAQNGFGKHYFAGAIISGGSATVFYKVTKKPLLSSFLGSLVGSTIGILKEEVYDRNMSRGTPSDSDKAATIMGSLCIILPFNIIVHECKINKEYYE